jgi:hypothetical protein
MALQSSKPGGFQKYRHVDGDGNGNSDTIPG